MVPGTGGNIRNVWRNHHIEMAVAFPSSTWACHARRRKTVGRFGNSCASMACSPARGAIERPEREVVAPATFSSLG